MPLSMPVDIPYAFEDQPTLVGRVHLQTEEHDDDAKRRAALVLSWLRAELSPSFVSDAMARLDAAFESTTTLPSAKTPT